MRVAVLGSGNGGCAAAFDFAAHGHEVNLADFDSFPLQIEAIAALGGIHSEGALEGFAPIAYSGHDFERALRGADLVVAVGPAFSTEPFGAACGPFLVTGQTVIVCPGSCAGALAFKRAAGLDLRDASVIVADTGTLPYAVRLIGPGRIHVYLKLGEALLLAAVPASSTAAVLEKVADTYPLMSAADSVLYTALANANPVIHPAVTVCNAAQIERTGGDLLFYEEGITPAVARLMEAVDRERHAIAASLGFFLPPDPDMGVKQGYMSEATYYPGYMNAPGFKGIRAQPQLDHRYLNEDVGFGLVFYQSLARQFGVPTPVVDGLIDVASAMMRRDYQAEGARTTASLGISGLSAEELNRLVA
jgi:opine dehydrogenase